MVDFRAELAALVAAYDEHGGQWSESDVDELWHAAERARDVLAQPETASAVEAAIAAGQPVMLPSGTVIADPAWFASLIPIRAADRLELERQPLRPIPVSERLPGPEDCDTEERCWFYTPACSVLYASWVLREPDSLRKWETHWLPAHALPLPEFDHE